MVRDSICGKDAEACFGLYGLSKPSKQPRLPGAGSLTHPGVAAAPASQNARSSRGEKAALLCMRARR